jgi:Uma2 family endonuclease
MSVRERDLIDEIDYPDSDGEPMAETPLHAKLMIDSRFALNRRFRDDPQVYVGVNMLMYWVEGDRSKSKAPDVFVTFGVSRDTPRRVWKVWAEGKAPDAVIEPSSRKTWREDMYEKWQLYARLGVREYFLCDPEKEYLPEPLIGWRLEGGQYLPVNANESGRLPSEVLGLDLICVATQLRFVDPQTGEALPTEEEETAARFAAEERAAQAEERAARMAARLRELGLNPDQL